jgi:hypothetical protein
MKPDENRRHTGAFFGAQAGTEAPMRAWFGPMLPEAEATWDVPGPRGMEAEEAEGTRADSHTGLEDSDGLVVPPLTGGASCRDARGRGGVSPRILFVVGGTDPLR